MEDWFRPVDGWWSRPRAERYARDGRGHPYPRTGRGPSSTAVTRFTLQPSGPARGTVPGRPAHGARRARSRRLSGLVHGARGVARGACPARLAMPVRLGPRCLSGRLSPLVPVRSAQCGGPPGGRSRSMGPVGARIPPTVPVRPAQGACPARPAQEGPARRAEPACRSGPRCLSGSAHGACPKPGPRCPSGSARPTGPVWPGRPAAVTDRRRSPAEPRSPALEPGPSRPCPAPPGHPPRPANCGGCRAE
jgi:hypothetical protein